MIVARPSELAGIAQEQAGDLVDLGPGQPDPSLLPFGLVRRHLDRALARYGAGALAYGANAGPLPAREALAAWASETEDGDFRAEQVLVVAGATQGIDLICTRMARPGDAALVQRTTYNLALELFRGRGIEAVPVGDDLAAPTGEDLVRAASEVTSRGKRVAFAYVVPTCHNPTGVSLTAGQRLDLLGGRGRPGSCSSRTTRIASSRSATGPRRRSPPSQAWTVWSQSGRSRSCAAQVSASGS